MKGYVFHLWLLQQKLKQELNKEWSTFEESRNKLLYKLKKKSWSKASINSSYITHTSKKKLFLKARLVSRNRHFMQIWPALGFTLKSLTAFLSFPHCWWYAHPAIQIFLGETTFSHMILMRGLYSATLKSPLTTVSFVNRWGKKWVLVELEVARDNLSQWGKITIVIELNKMAQHGRHTEPESSWL